MEKKNYGKLKILLIVIAILLIVLIVARSWFGGLLGKTHFVKDEDVELNQEALETETETEKQLHPADVYDLSGVTLATDEEIENTYTLLVIGGASPEEEEKGGRADADAVITMTINHNSQEVILYSFHTDMYVEIPEVGGGRLGNAYAVGGGPLLTQVMEKNYGIRINNYACISLKDVAREIGMPEFETLDIGRDGLQVVKELVYSLNAVGPVKVAGYITGLLPYVTHNLEDDEMLRIIMQIPRIIPYYGVEGMMPGDEPYQMIDQYIVPDAGKLSADFKARIYTKETGGTSVTEAGKETET